MSEFHFAQDYQIEEHWLIEDEHAFIFTLEMTGVVPRPASVLVSDAFSSGLGTRVYL